MDLNKPINLELKFNKDFLQANRIQLSIGAVGLILTATLAYLSYERYERFNTLEETKAVLAQLEQSRLTLNKQIEDQYKKHATELQSLKSAPKSKTQLQASITSQAEKYKVKVIKLIAADSTDKASTDSIEFEFQGPYNGMRDFLGEISALIGASQVQKLKLSPSQKSGEVIASLSIVYLPPPPNLVQGKAAYQIGRIKDYQFDSFENWSLARTQFVPKDQKESQKLNADGSGAGGLGEVPSPSRNPFETPPKNLSATENGGKNGFAEISESPEKKLNSYYLSGIIYSPNKRLCAVTLPAGETKIFMEGQVINNRIKIIKIDKNKVLVDSGKKMDIKVGDEIPL
jgi:hypothetical protein